MIIPVGTYSQRFMQVDKDAQGQITQKDLFGVVVRGVESRSFASPGSFVAMADFASDFLWRRQYVPLTDRPA